MSSGAIRSQIGPTKSRLGNQLDNKISVVVPFTYNEQSLSENIHNLRCLRPKLMTEQQKLLRSVERLSTLDKEWHELMGKMDSENIEAELGHYERTSSGESGYLSVLHEGEDRVDQLTAWLTEMDQTMKDLTLQEALAPDSTLSQHAQAQLDNSTPPVNYSQTPNNQDIRLPRLQLPSFNGDILQFPGFWDAFESSIHQTSMSPVLKLTHLKSYLTGPAVQTLAGLSITNANYSVAISLLKNRYGRKEIIIEKLYSKLRNLSMAKSGKSIDLRDFVDELESTLRQLEAQGEDITHHSFVGLVLDRLPKMVNLKLHEQYKSTRGPWNLLSLRQALSELVQTQEEVFGVAIANQQTNFSVIKETRNRNAFIIQQNQGETKRVPNCILCGNTHFSDECDIYKTLESRKQRFWETKRCFICTKQNCIARYCKAPVRECVHCKVKGKHCRMLCPSIFSQRPNMAYHVNLTECGLEENQTEGMEGHTMTIQARAMDDTSSRRNQSNAVDPRVFNNKSREVKNFSGTLMNPEHSLDAQEKVVGDENSQPCEESVTDGSNAMMHEVTHPNDICHGGTATQLMTLKAVIANTKSKGKVQVRLFFDTGSHLSFISAKIAKTLKLDPICQTKLTLNLFGHKTSEFDSELVQIDLMSTSEVVGMQHMISILAYTAPQLTQSMTVQALTKEDKQFLKPHSIQVPVGGEVFNIDIIIGQDYFWKIVKPEKVILLPSGLLLIDTELGPVITGSSKKSKTQLTQSSSYVVVLQDNEQSKDKIVNGGVPANSESSQYFFDKELQKFWSLETVGITEDPTIKDDDIAIEQFNKSIRFEDGRYTVGWPWKFPQLNLHHNYLLALARFRNLIKRFIEEPHLLIRYNEIIQDQLRKGIIEVVKMEEADGHVYYIPHLAVITPTKTTTKLRIVYDASAKRRKGDLSLNECLFAGPCLIPDLVGLLMRFRLGSIGLVSDVEKAYLQIGLNLEDRDVTRFIWFKNSNKIAVENNIQIFRFKRVPFGVISSPFLLNATVQYHLRKNASEISNTLAENMYVDNLLISTSTEEEAFTTYAKARELFGEMNMNLREWSTNSTDLQCKIPNTLSSTEASVKILGMNWNTNTDAMSVTYYQKGCEELKKKDPTKRSILHNVASLYDPLGIFSPVTLMGKLLLKQLWEEKLSWDDPLSNQYVRKWQEIETSFQEIPKIQVPRYIGENIRSKHIRNSLIVFVDASTKAYAAVVFLKSENISKGNTSNVRLIFSKTRIAKEHITLPRLELMATLIGVRAASFVKTQLKTSIAETILFTDSKIVLNWIKTTKPLSTFVMNRIKEINSMDQTTFYHVKSHLNPADCASRGLSTKQLITHKLWWQGPEWIKKPNSEWPKDEIQVQSLDGNELLNFAKELKLKEVTLQLAVIIQPEPAIQFSRFSQFQRLVNTVKYVLKFIHFKVWMKLPEEFKQKDSLIIQLISTIEDITLSKNARKLIFRQMQRTDLSELYEILQKGKENISNSKVYAQYQNLAPALGSDGIIRLQGRLKHVYLQNSEGETNWQPILLPTKSIVSKLLVEHIHRTNYHAGVQQTLSALRKSMFWLTQGRRTVKSILTKCIICKKAIGGPYKLPPMAPLPIERLTPSPAFQNIGIDYFGPITVKLHENKIKAWVCLFTCLSTRGIHLELVPNMSAATFLNCLRRFIARRGHPINIISDNAPQFKLVHNAIKKTTSSVPESHIQSYLSNNQIRWQFITQYSPWKGGVYERLVGITKQALKKTIGAKHVDWDTITTMLCEVEAIVNTRPLTVVTEEFQEKCLTPIDLIQYNNTICSPFLDSDEPNDPDYIPRTKSSHETLIQYWKKSHAILNKFWEYFIDHYILSLRERQQLQHKKPRVTSHILPKLNEAVLVIQEDTPRGLWKLAIITALHFGEDKHVRSATVRFTNGTTTKRSINHLVPLELSEDNDDQAGVKDSFQICMVNDEYEMACSSSHHKSVADLPPPPPPPKPITNPSTQTHFRLTPTHLLIKLGNSAAILPSRATEESVGLDLYSSENKIIDSHSWTSIDTNIQIEIPYGYFGNITARSGLAYEHGISCLCGTIDQDYRGNIKVILMNNSKQPYKVHFEDKIAQILILPYLKVKPHRVNSLTPTKRDTSGFGSSDPPLLPTKKENKDTLAQQTTSCNFVTTLKIVGYGLGFTILLIWGGLATWIILKLPQTRAAPAVSWGQFLKKVGYGSGTALVSASGTALGRASGTASTKDILGENLLRSAIRRMTEHCKNFNINSTINSRNYYCRKFLWLKEVQSNISTGAYPPSFYEELNKRNANRGVVRTFIKSVDFLGLGNIQNHIQNIQSHIQNTLSDLKDVSLILGGIVVFFLLTYILIKLMRYCNTTFKFCGCICREYWTTVCGPCCTRAAAQSTEVEMTPPSCSGVGDNDSSI